MSYAARTEARGKPAAERGGAAPSFHVPAWLDFLSGLVERFPRFWIRVGDWETRHLREQIADVAIDRPIFLTGLARAGTTILLEQLARHPALVTHRYRDFPLVTAPWLWNWLLDRAATRPPPARERAHRDGIVVTAESPEAFEEIIWMMFFPHLHDPARSAVLDAGTSHPDFEAFYRDHLRKLLRLRGGSRYLAKGNYAVTRLPYLLKLFPDARFVVPIRDPIWHIASLMKQHALFCREETKDKRVLRHMRRAGHFEFGLDLRAINSGDAGATARVQDLWRAGRAVEGWAAYWNLIYAHLADLLEADPAVRAATLVVRFEELCRRPGETLAAILDHCALSREGLPEQAAAAIRHPGYYRPQFSPAEKALIRDRTRQTARRFGYRAAAG